MAEFDVLLERDGEIDKRHVVARDEDHAREVARRLFLGPEHFHYREILAVESVPPEEE